LLSVEERMAEAFSECIAGASCPEDWEIAALVASETSGDAAIRISSHLQRCRHCIDRAARYHKALLSDPPGRMVPETWRNAAIAALEGGAGKAEEDRPGFLVRLRDSLRWLAVLPPLPGYAAAGVAIVFIALLYAGDRKRAIVIPSTEKFVFRETEPTGALGFMGGELPPPPEKRMALSSSGNTIVFRWEPPGGCSGYSFSLSEKNSGNVLWSRPDVGGAEVAVPGNLFSGDKVYSWSIEATLADGRKIGYTGEFLYQK
jgi:hypothetical protein